MSASILPGTVKMGPVVYELIAVDDVEFSHNGQSAIGHVAHDELVMRLATRLPDDRLFVVLWHEILHAVEALFGLDLEEGEVDQLAHGIVMVLRDNPSTHAMEGWA